MSEFTEALRRNDLSAVRKVAKSDLHNHCMTGGKLRSLEKFCGHKLEKFNEGKDGVRGINAWLGRVFRPVMEQPGAMKAAIEAAFQQAESDGVTVLEMSIDLQLGRLFNFSPEEIISLLKTAHKEIAPGTDYRPEIGISRGMSVRSILSLIGPYFDSGYFRSIDLYDIEDLQPPKNFREIYLYARSLGLKCKAHAGEFGDGVSVREAVETLQLDAVQHGNGAADSPEIMKWLAGNKVQLNVCPASNMRLKRTRSYKTHPIRILYDHGVKVTVNTDDVLLFNKGNSEQFLQLSRSGVFSPDELDEIRRNGL